MTLAARHRGLPVRHRRHRRVFVSTCCRSVRRSGRRLAAGMVVTAPAVAAPFRLRPGAQAAALRRRRGRPDETRKKRGMASSPPPSCHFHCRESATRPRSPSPAWATRRCLAAWCWVVPWSPTSSAAWRRLPGAAAGQAAAGWIHASGGFFLGLSPAWPSGSEPAVFPSCAWPQRRSGEGFSPAVRGRAAAGDLGDFDPPACGRFPRPGLASSSG